MFVSYKSKLSAAIGRSIGISMDETDWKYDFSEINSCMMLSSSPLLYSDTKQFQPFGAWSTYDLKYGK